MTATMIPKVAPEEIANEGERLVYAALRDQLPDGWVVRYSYFFSTRERYGNRDRESDFIVMAPGLGLLFVEVKQSYGYDCHDGVFYRLKEDGSREEAEKNPFEQAMKCKYRVVEEILCPRLNVLKRNFPGLYGHAVIYPKARIEGNLPPSQEQSIVMTYKDMNRLGEVVPAALRKWGHADTAAKFIPEVFERVRKALADECRFVAADAARADEDDQWMDILTDTQYAAYEGILAQPRVRLQGPAGSGKTMIAIRAAMDAATKGGRVLYLCYNRVLAEWLRSKWAPPRNLAIKHFHALCREYAAEAGIRFAPPDDDSEAAKAFWGEQSSGILDQAATKLGDGRAYDAVFVDEAQDFHQDWWIPIELLLKEGGRLYLFHDPLQSGVYGHGELYPANFPPPVPLSVNCRNTRRIAALCGKIVDRDAPGFKHSPVGILPRIEQPQLAVAARAKAARKVVQDWVGEGFLPRRIAVLSPWKKDNPQSSLGILAGGGSPAAEQANVSRWLDGEKFWASTIKSFKGLEADCVVVTDVPATGAGGFTASEMYVAASRARHRLVLVPTSAEAYSELLRWSRGIT